MSKCLLVLIPFVLLSLSSFSQGDSLDNAPPRYRGWKPQNQASLFIADFNQRMRVSHNPLNSGKGLGLEVGFNPAYFFNRRLLLGVFGGIAMRDVFYNTKFSSSYRNDFNQSFNSTGFQGNDSLVANKFASIINDGSFHDQELYYGIIFRLPYAWAPVVKLYTGDLNWVYKTDNHLRVTPSSETRNDNDYYNISHHIQWGAEIFLFWGYTKIGDYGKLPFAKKKPLLFSTRVLPLSFFIERINSARSEYSFDTGEMSVVVPQSRILGDSFIQKYKSNYYFGFRLLYGTF